MKETRKRMTKKWIISIVILLLVGGASAAYFALGGERMPEYETAVVERGDVRETVSVTGKVRPAVSVDLAFEISGRVERVSIKEGGKVLVGAELVRIAGAEQGAELARKLAAVRSAEASLEQYRSSRDAARAKLAELRRGTRDEEINVQEVSVENAESALREAEKNLLNVLRDAYTKTEDAIRNKVDQIFSNPRSTNPQLIFNAYDATLESDLESGRFHIEGTLGTWRTRNDGLTAANMQVESATIDGYLSEARGFLEKAASAVNNISASSNHTQATIDGWRADVSTARTSVNTAVTNIIAANEKWRTAQSSLRLEEQELLLKKAGAAPEAIAAQEAMVKETEANIVAQLARISEAEANVRASEVVIGKNVLRAPISGIVTVVDVSPGEIITAQKSIVSIISEAEFEVEVNIPEADIAKIALGDGANITLDAYGDDRMFIARVTRIDRAETIVEGVATYKSVLQFAEKSDDVRSGMTANIDVITDERAGVLFVPSKAVMNKDGKKIVRIVTGEAFRETEVVAGLRGSDGRTEIQEGLAEGDRVVSFIKEQ